MAENTSACEDCGCEHGLSLFIETKGHKLLFDTGQTELFSKNAEKLGIDLSSVDIAVLSHGHYDHGGGLRRFLELNDTAPVYLSRFAFEPHYNGEKYIGLDVSLRDSDRLVYVGDNSTIAEGIDLYSCNGSAMTVPLLTGGLSVEENGEKVPEDFRHEQFLLIEEDGRRILFSGCSHKGILNIAEWFSPDVLFGGFHFMKLPVGDELKACAERLDGFDTDYYTFHCTGTEQYGFMKRYLRRLRYLSTGESIEI